MFCSRVKSPVSSFKRGKTLYSLFCSTQLLLSAFAGNVLEVIWRAYFVSCVNYKKWDRADQFGRLLRGKHRVLPWSLPSWWMIKWSCCKSLTCQSQFKFYDFNLVLITPVHPRRTCFEFLNFPLSPHSFQPVQIQFTVPYEPSSLNQRWIDPVGRESNPAGRGKRQS